MNSVHVTRRRGVNNSQIFADVIHGWSEMRIARAETRLVDGEGGRIEVGEPADLVPGFLAILVLEVAGKVLEDEPVHPPPLFLVPARSLDRVPESNGDGDRADDDVVRGRESREGSCTRNRTSCPSRAVSSGPRRTGCRVSQRAYSSMLPPPLTDFSTTCTGIHFVRAATGEVPQGSAKLIRASSDKNAFGVKRGERRFDFALGRVPSTPSRSLSPRFPTASSLARSFAGRKGMTAAINSDSRSFIGAPPMRSTARADGRTDAADGGGGPRQP